MAKASRGSLGSLADRLAPKTLVSEAVGSVAMKDQAPSDSQVAPSGTARGVRDFKTMMCRVNRAGWAEMSRLAIDTDTNLEDLLIEACNDLLHRKGRPPVIEKRAPAPRR